MRQDEIETSLLNLERFDPRHRKSGRWLVFNRSPLARKIILFNLIALGILVSGVLYLSQSQETQVKIRGDDLVRQAALIATSLQSHTGEPEYEDQQGQAFTLLFQSLAESSDSVVEIYGPGGSLTQAHIPGAGESAPVAQESDAFSNLLQKLWAGLTTAGSAISPEIARKDLEAEWKGLAAEAMAAGTRTKNVTFSVGGEIYIAVAQPLSGSEGAILISTRAGEVDSIIRAAREQILQVFLLATLSSIILSMVLANSIARPLRRLSAAAQKAQDEAGERINLARVNIPDLTARPDEIGQLSRAMRNMTEALLDRVDENKSFAADVAHEIKNPLTSLRSAVETLDYVQDDASRKELLAVIQNDVERLDRLVSDISSASRLEGELVRDKWEDVDICTMLQEMVNNFQLQESGAGVSIELFSEAEDHHMRGLPTRLEQVFTNLIGNALSFVPEDGKVSIYISEDGPDWLKIRVRDNGPGIPPENLDDIFSRFYSERPEAQFGEHSGLGLAISKQIIEAHGGSIVARNSKVGGALFTIKLPR